jgi:hypothetical protein
VQVQIGFYHIEDKGVPLRDADLHGSAAIRPRKRGVVPRLPCVANATGGRNYDRAPVSRSRGAVLRTGRQCAAGGCAAGGCAGRTAGLGAGAGRGGGSEFL